MLFVSAIVLFTFFRSVSGTSEDKLITDLLRNYNRKARPRPYGPSKPVVINMQMFINAIDDLDAKKQHFKTRAYLSFIWKDPRLTWNPSDYAGISRLVFNPADVWVPEIGLWNTVSDYFDNSHYDRIFVRVSNDSTVAWEPGGTFVSICEIDIRYFPFDEQVCHLEFGNWANIGNDVNITTATDEMDTASEYVPHVEWDLVKTKVIRHEDSFPCCPGVYPYVHFKFHLRRKPLYFVMNIIVPSVMLSMLVLLVFLLPPESGEKISLGVTILVAYALFILMISESVPRTSVAVPIIMIYLMFFMGCSTVGLLLSVLVLYLHHKSGNDIPPAWLQKLASCLSVLIRHRNIKMSELSVDNKKKNDTQYMENDIQKKKTIQKIEACLEEMNSDKMHNKRKEIAATLIQAYHGEVDHGRFNEKASQWKEIATVIDRFALVLFGSVIIVLSCIILGVIPVMKPSIDLEK